ncbi:thiamine pyrophosphate-binding protein [Clostridium oceanicum]|uniref:Biosynthetic-type acetolactate synthase large subunit n=1 Tax=Clostridium oceanicum TaxID=1543 RepID=A0ABN1JBL6_9CLOT
MKVCEAVLDYLIKNNIKTLYGIPCGTFSAIVDCIDDFNEIELIIPKNEGAAGFSATKYAKISRKLGVCILGGSVGVANAMNGIAEAEQTKSPVLIIGGYVNQPDQNLGAIQELEGHRLVKDIVKHYTVVENEKETLTKIKEAMEKALEYPRGPVFVGLPINIQRQEYTGEDIEKVSIKNGETDYASLDKAVDMINDCKNGVILLGGGCRKVSDKIKKLEEKLNWRIFYTSGGKGIIEDDYRLNMGNYGFCSTKLASEYMKRDDIECVLALGSQLGELASNYFDKTLFKNRKLIHIDVDKRVFQKAFKADLPITSDLDNALDYLCKIDKKDLNNDIKELRNKPYVKDHKGLSVRLLYENITNILPKNTFYMQDIGLSMAFAYKYLSVPKGGGFECNPTYGSMGSTSGALGVSRLYKDRVIAVFIGDGAFYMNVMSELLTAKKYNMNIIYFVINNSALGLVAKGQKMVYKRAHSGFYDEDVDIHKIVEAMGIPSVRIDDFNQIKDLKDLLKDRKGPMVIEVITDLSENIYIDRFKTLKIETK